MRSTRRVARGRRRPHRLRWCALLAGLLVLPVTGCGRQLSAGEERGRRLIDEHGCGSCHVVPGVRAARGVTGPPLTGWGERVLIAGKLPNTGPDLVRWIMDPQSVEPGTAMPDLDVGAEDAAAIARYLLTLERPAGWGR